MEKYMQKILFYSLLFVLHSIAEAKLDDHFKKAPNKSSVNKMKNIDFIYVINLDQRPEKFAKCLHQLELYDIIPYRFSAVNGWELSLETINDVGLKYALGMEGGFMATSYLPEGNFAPHHEEIQHYGQTYFCHCFARGTVGIALSHLSVLQDAYDSGFGTIWVMEDDIEVVQDPRKISDLVEKLDVKVGEWDLLFTDRDIRDKNGNYVPAYGMARRPDFKPADLSQYFKRYDLDENFRAIGARFGAHSMIIRRSGIEKILNFFKIHQIFLPYDMDFYLPEGLLMYTVQNDIVTNQAKAISDNGAPGYLNK